jgi:hypothetical protein
VKIPRAAPCVCRKLRLACSTSGLKLKKIHRRARLESGEIGYFCGTTYNKGTPCYFFALLLQSYNLTLLQFYNLTLLQFYFNTILQFYFTAILQYYLSTILAFYNSTILQYYFTAIGKKYPEPLLGNSDKKF